VNERPESITIRDALDALGIIGLPEIRGLPFEQRVERVEKWKVEVLRPRFKQLVRELHPDRVGGDTAAMAKVNAARDVLEKLEPVREPETHGHVVIVETTVIFGGPDGTTTSSTSTWRRSW
jgi:hypothetical protein